MRTVFQILIISLSSTFVVGNSYAQEKEDSIIIKGTVVDENNEPIIYAWVDAKVKDRILGRGFTDSTGNYLFKVNSTYSSSFYINVSSWGYLEHRVINIPFTEVLIDMHTIQLAPRHLEPIEITTQCPPKFDKYGSGNTKTITAEEIERGAY